MNNKKGFTLIEMIVVLIIIAILTAIAVTNYTTYTQQASSTSAQNTLISIYNAQKNYYFNNGSYCTTTSAAQSGCTGLNSKCGTSLATLNCNLSLNVTDNYFTYACKKGGSSSGGFKCTATNVSDNNFTMTLKNTAIVLPGGSGTANPSCKNTKHSSYCPS